MTRQQVRRFVLGVLLVVLALLPFFGIVLLLAQLGSGRRILE